MEIYSHENDAVTKLKLGVHKKFEKLRTALQMREKLLLRQLEAVVSTHQRMAECHADNSLMTKSKLSEGGALKILFENEDELLRSIRSFGQFQLGSILLALKQEDYITPNCDHEIMYKDIKSDYNEFNALPQQKLVIDQLVIDFSKDKSLIEHTTKFMNDSIVNITLEEAKELIRKARITNEAPIPLLNLEELDDELESSIADAVSSLNHDSNTNLSEALKHNSSDTWEKGSVKKPKFGRSKQKVTINNCRGTINLQNISSVTINCGSDKCEYNDDLKSYINLTDPKSCASTDINPIVPIVVDCVSECSTPSSADTFSNQSSNSHTRSQSKEQKNGKANNFVDQMLQNRSLVTKTDNTNGQVINNSFTNFENGTLNTDTEIESKITCNFYNRLLDEIKRNLNQRKTLSNTGRTKTHLNSAAETEITEQSAQNSALFEQQQVWKHFRNLNIAFNNDRPDECGRPVHIEQWLSDIIKDTDLEPMQNIDMLEHSKINECALNSNK